MPSPSPARVFVSHATADREFVETEVVSVLQQRGLDPWYSKVSIRSAAEWEREIRKALSECDWFLVVVSANAVGSAWVKAEVDWAVGHRWGQLATVLMEECDPGDLNLRLPQLQHIRFAADADRGRRQLQEWIDQLRASRGRPKPLGHRLVLTFVGAKGGVGKSTLACRTAEMIAENGRGVLLVDLDTGAAGTTNLQRSRGNVSAASTSTYELLEVLAAHPTATPTARPLDVTPAYLSERADGGRVYLLPAVPPNKKGGMPTGELLQAIRGSGGQEAIERAVDRLLSAADGCSPPIECVVFDCGAEGAEFNALVPEVHRRAALTYVVVEPGPICRDNLPRVTELLTRGAPYSEKTVRLVINRVYSAQHEPAVRNQFSDYVIAGCVPNDPQLFEDVQKGTVNHRYGYDKLSAAVRGVLAHANELPPDLIPDERNLWVRPTARAVLDNDPLDLFLRTKGRGLFLWTLLLLVGLAVAGMGLFGFASAWLNPPADTTPTTATPTTTAATTPTTTATPAPPPGTFNAATRAALLSATIWLAGGLTAATVGVMKLRPVMPLLWVAKRLSRIARTATDKQKAVEDHLSELAAVSPDSPALRWVREATRRGPADRPGEGDGHG